MSTIAVTGATGHLGGLIVDAVLARGIAATDVVTIVRDRQADAVADMLRAAGIEVAS